MQCVVRSVGIGQVNDHLALHVHRLFLSRENQMDESRYVHRLFLSREKQTAKSRYLQGSFYQERSKRMNQGTAKDYLSGPTKVSKPLKDSVTKGNFSGNLENYCARHYYNNNTGTWQKKCAKNVDIISHIRSRWDHSSSTILSTLLKTLFDDAVSTASPLMLCRRLLTDCA